MGFIWYATLYGFVGSYIGGDLTRLLHFNFFFFTLRGSSRQDSDVLDELNETLHASNDSKHSVRSSMSSVSVTELGLLASRLLMLKYFCENLIRFLQHLSTRRFNLRIARCLNITKSSSFPLFCEHKKEVFSSSPSLLFTVNTGISFFPDAEEMTSTSLISVSCFRGASSCEKVSPSDSGTGTG